MHRFLTAFLCLSTLAMTQNVVAVTPSPFVSPESQTVVAEVGEGAVRLAGLQNGGQAVGNELPSPGAMLLLVTGLAGLSAVGSRAGTAKQAIRS